MFVAVIANQTVYARSYVLATHTNLATTWLSRYSHESSFSTRVISVPRPNTLPRGSGNNSKELSSAEELKTYCVGLGFFGDLGARDET
jgi:hypothetical protein